MCTSFKKVAEETRGRLPSPLHYLSYSPMRRRTPVIGDVMRVFPFIWPAMADPFLPVVKVLLPVLRAIWGVERPIF